MQKKPLDNQHHALERLYNISYPQFGGPQNFVQKATPELHHFSYIRGFSNLS